MNWNPYTIYTWTRKQVRQWIKENPVAMHSGYKWDINARHIAAGMYKVTFIKG